MLALAAIATFNWSQHTENGLFIYMDMNVQHKFKYKKDDSNPGTEVALSGLQNCNEKLSCLETSSNSIQCTCTFTIN